MEDKLKGELMDLQHGLAFLGNIKINAGSGNVLLISIFIYTFSKTFFDFQFQIMLCQLDQSFAS